LRGGGRHPRTGAARDERGLAGSDHDGQMTGGCAGGTTTYQNYLYEQVRRKIRESPRPNKKRANTGNMALPNQTSTASQRRISQKMSIRHIQPHK